jgi:hypothetical protein
MKRLFTSFLYLSLAGALYAQPQICSTPAAMTSTCAEACIICDIDGFTGINNSSVTGQAPPGFCTSFVHHMQWIAFQAGSVNLTLKLSVFGCQNGEGLEVGIYQSSDCQSFTKVSNCDTDIPNNSSQTFTNTVPLVIGQYYYFVMDGSNGDICNYRIEVLNGSTEVSPLSGSGTITGVTKVCPGVPHTYTADGVTGAIKYEWTIDGLPAGNGNSVTMNWPTAGVHELCVTASNACDEAVPTCKTIIVAPIPPTSYVVALCPGDCFAVADTMLCDPGNYSFKYPTPSGCDSIINALITLKSADVTNLNLNICDGESFSISNQNYTQTGQYQQTLINQEGCDSIVNLNLLVIICEIQGNTSVQGVACAGGSTGRIDFKVTNGTPGFTYSWQRIGGVNPLTGQGTLGGVNTTESISNLPAGLYYITVNDQFGNDVVLSATVTEAPPLTAAILADSYNGFGVRCAGNADGVLHANGAGGYPPYQFKWSDGGTGAVRTSLGNGQFTVTISDFYACTYTTNFTLIAPPPLELSATFTDPSCAGPETGAVQMKSNTGGIPPYLFALNDTVFTANSSFPNLPEGAYNLVLQDLNGCKDTVLGQLTAAHIPVINLNGDQTVDLGEGTSIQATYDVLPNQFVWSDTLGFSCYDCLEPDVRPWKTTKYILTTTSEDGCTASDSVTITVKEKRDFFIPNVFNPDSKQGNERFTVFGGPELVSVKSLRVYGRWGELVYENKNFAPNTPKEGWDGMYRGKELTPGVYVWIAELAFFDRVSAVYNGNVTVVR